jgi:hypothetical protein
MQPSGEPREENRMSGKVWFSSFMSDYRIGNKQGLRTKFRGEEWEPPQHMVAAESAKVYAAAMKHSKGYSLAEDDLPEAVAVFDTKSFRRAGELFVAGRFYAVKKQLADVLENFDLGDGGLIPFEIYENDLVTPIKEQFYYLNFGARKKSFYRKKVERSSSLRQIHRLASDCGC